jgi:hypothetical protein
MSTMEFLPPCRGVVGQAGEVSLRENGKCPRPAVGVH